MPVRLKDISQPCQPVSPDARAGQLLQRFLAEPSLSIIPVVFDRTPVGIAVRDTLMAFAVKAGSETLAALPVSRIMDSNPQIADENEVLTRLTSTSSPDRKNLFRHGVLVTQQGRYSGHAPADAIAGALAEENLARARALRQMRDQMTEFKRAEHRKHRAQIGHLAAIGHEIRTPLSVMVGHADRLATNSDLPAQARDSARLLAQTSAALSKLANDFVETGEVGLSAVRIDKTACTVRELAATLIELWRPSAEARDLELALNIARRVPDRLLVDPTRLKQILGNLISNAIKHTHFGTVELSVDWEAGKEDGCLILQVRDTGPGLSPDAAEQLFQPFARPGDMAETGTGLGLYISHTLARRMEGELSYSPGAETGSVFTLRLPARPARPVLAAQTPVERRRGAFELGTVLIVDDHEASRWLIKTALADAGWQVEEATSLEQARRRADHKAYQAILCDLHLQDGDGEALATEIRTGIGPNRDGLLLALSADGRTARRDACTEAGFDGFLAKPIRSGELITQLADFIATSRESETVVLRRA